MFGITCPQCHTDDNIQDYKDFDLYVCSNCGKVLGYYCEGCDRLYPPHQNLRKGAMSYSCKYCGYMHLGYTDYMRDKIKRYGENVKESDFWVSLR